VSSESILQQCLEDMAAGRKTPAQCAADNPEVAGLREQLEAAQWLRAWAPPTMAPAAARRHQAQLRAALAPRRPRAMGVPRWAFAALVIVALLAGGAGTVGAAGNSLPGQALYAVKRATEALQTVLTPPAKRAAWHATLAEERTTELQSLIEPAAGNATLVGELAAEIGRQTEAALLNVQRAPREEQANLLRLILAQLDRQQTAFSQAQAALPSQAALAQAVDVTRAQHDAALDQLATLAPAPADDATATATHTPTNPTPTSTAITPTATATRTATATTTATSLPAATTTPPGNSGGQTPNCRANSPNSPQYCTPTAGAPAGATTTAPGNSGDQTPNCHANNPNSPQYCTPTPGPSGGENPPPGDPPPTPCPLNPGGQPVCSNHP
jgi:hypothetical protein